MHFALSGRVCAQMPSRRACLSLRPSRQAQASNVLQAVVQYVIPSQAPPYPITDTPARFAPPTSRFVRLVCTPYPLVGAD